jgi:hypothetical protein
MNNDPISIVIDPETISSPEGNYTIWVGKVEYAHAIHTFKANSLEEVLDKIMAASDLPLDWVLVKKEVDDETEVE